jgi:hypothetical protein
MVNEKPFEDIVQHIILLVEANCEMVKICLGTCFDLLNKQKVALAEH